MGDRKKSKILFLCTGNSCRSQMAEGFARQLKTDEIDAYSAGMAPNVVDPRAIRAMGEIGIDISDQRSKSLDDLKDMEFDWVITLCDNAQKTCPAFPGDTPVVHVGFEDPPRMASDSRDEEEAMAHYRFVRDKIKVFVEKLPECLIQRKQKVGFDRDRFLAGLKSVLDQFSKDL